MADTTLLIIPAGLSAELAGSLLQVVGDAFPTSRVRNHVAGLEVVLPDRGDRLVEAFTDALRAAGVEPTIVDDAEGSITTHLDRIANGSAGDAAAHLVDEHLGQVRSWLELDDRTTDEAIASQVWGAQRDELLRAHRYAHSTDALRAADQEAARG